MLDYLVVKALRNQMNHAGGNDENATNESGRIEREESCKEEAQNRVLQYYKDYHTEEQMFGSLNIAEIIERDEIEKVIAFLGRSLMRIWGDYENVRWNEAKAGSVKNRAAEEKTNREGYSIPVNSLFNNNKPIKFKSNYTNNERVGHIETYDGKKYEAIMPARYMKQGYSGKNYKSMENVSIKRIEGDHYIVCPK